MKKLREYVTLTTHTNMTLITNKRKRILTLLELTFLFIVPVVLLYLGLIPAGLQLTVLLIYTVFVLILIFQGHITSKTLQIRTDNLVKDFLPYVLFTIAGAGVLIGLASMLGKGQYPVGNLYLLFLAWSLPVSLIQELIYRGFLMHELHRLYASTAAIILINAALFTFLHILFPQPLIVLPLMFCGGIAFAWMYTKYPNLILISLSHAVLNCVAIKYSFFLK